MKGNGELQQRLAQWRGQWALVTGASAGIGREFAVQLAGLGMNLVLVARREDELKALAGELEGSYGISTRVLATDLADRAAVGNIQSMVTGHDIRVRLLVNNAGIGSWGPFQSAQLPRYLDLMEVNCVAPMLLAGAFRDDLADGGALINVSSQGSFNPLPYMAVYGASKAFLHNLSLSLYEEWREQGVYVQTLVPAPTRTGFDQKAGGVQGAIEERGEPLEVVIAALEGLARKRPFVTNAKGIFQQRLFAGVAPLGFVVKMVGRMFKPKGP